MRKISYISGTRSDYGLEVPLLQAIRKSKKTELQLYATGMHLMPNFGYTIDLIKKEFPKVGIINVKFTDDSCEARADFAAKLLQAIVYEFKKKSARYSTCSWRQSRDALCQYGSFIFGNSYCTYSRW